MSPVLRLFLQTIILIIALSGCEAGRPRRESAGSAAVDSSTRTKPASAPRAGTSLALLLRIPGEKLNGELGFRFGRPRDIDGDGVAEVAAGARFSDLEFPQMGYAAVWSTGSGRELAYWEGHTASGLFGQCVVIGPDIDADGHPDVVAGAASGKYDDRQRGILYARSAVNQRLLWSVVGEVNETLGWQFTLTEDRDGDGIEELLVGAPGKGEEGKAYLLSGRDGSILRQFRSSERDDLFGWYVASVPDLDGDGRADVLVGAPGRTRDRAANAGAAYAFSGEDGRRLHAWFGDTEGAGFGKIVEGLPDLNGDGRGEVAVAATFHPNLSRDESTVGVVSVFSGATGEVVHRWRGRQHGELYGRIVAAAGDLDGDGVGDVAVGAPWSDAGAKSRAGRFEVRSGRTGEIIAEAAGERAEMWLGWHIAAGDGLGRKRERGLVVSALRSEENGLVGAGSLHVYAAR